MNIITWHAPSSSGAFQRLLPDGRLFSDRLTTKPVFSFSFGSMEYVEQADRFTIDNVPMTAAQRAEALAAINAVNPPVDWYRAAKAAELDQAYRATVAAIAGWVDVAEMASWQKQEAEARAVLASPGNAAPFIEGLRGTRGKGESKVQLAQKIVDKADAFATAYAPVLGRRHARMDALDAAQTVEGINAIVW